MSLTSRTLSLSAFIATFGKNNTERHYQPVAEIDAADKVGPLNMAGIARKEGYKTYK